MKWASLQKSVSKITLKWHYEIDPRSPCHDVQHNFNQYYDTRDDDFPHSAIQYNNK